MNEWYKLDNAAKLFPTVTNVRYSSVFRVAAVLGGAIDKGTLQKAVDHVFARFPMLFLRLRRGVFWNYFDTVSDKFYVLEEKEFPCAMMNPNENGGYLVRILYYGKRVSVEIFHSLTDGGGAVEFLKTLLFYYLRFQGAAIDGEGKILLAEGEAAAEEMDDSFTRYYKPLAKQPGKGAARSFRIKGTAFPAYGNNVVTGLVSGTELIQAAKAKHATVTSYLAAVLMEAIYQEQQRYASGHAPIVAQIPVNLRKLFPSRTLRNFFGVANVGMSVTPSTTFDDMVREATEQLKARTDEAAMQRCITENVSLEKKLYSRFIPLPVKKLVIMLGSNIMGESRKTISISNLGSIAVPSGFSPYVSHMEATLYPTPKSPLNCAVCSMGDRLAITFSRTIAEADIIRRFFQHLAETDDVAVEVYSNDWGTNP